MDATQAATQNEDWPKVAAWDVTDDAGNPITDLDGLAALLGMDRTAAANELLGSPVATVAPPALVAEAHAELTPDPDQASLFDQAFGDDDSAGPDAEDTSGGGSDDPADDGLGGDLEDGKAFPWQKDGDKKGSGLKAGSWVSGNFGTGKIDLVVSNGKVPGVDSDVEGTKDKPAARVRVYENGKATDKRVAALLSGLKSTFPQKPKSEKKDGSAGLVLLVTEADDLPDDQRPTADAIRTVYERGIRSWPGESKTALTPDAWGLGRARAFLEKAQGIGMEGYVGDDDLLPS